jgi:hypothetical protein
MAIQCRARSTIEDTMYDQAYHTITKIEGTKNVITYTIEIYVNQVAYEYMMQPFKTFTQQFLPNNAISASNIWTQCYNHYKTTLTESYTEV